MAFKQFPVSVKICVSAWQGPYKTCYSLYFAFHILMIYFLFKFTFDFHISICMPSFLEMDIGMENKGTEIFVTAWNSRHFPERWKTFHGVSGRATSTFSTVLDNEQSGRL